jgi:hypothetical protein
MDIHDSNEEVTDIEFTYNITGLREEWLSQDVIDFFVITREILEHDVFNWDWNEIASSPWLSGWHHDSGEDFISRRML